MAEPPGPPRKSTTYQRQEGMNSQRERFGVKPNEMFWLENVMRVAPKKLHSVPGPRQVAIFPIPVPSECIDSTLRGQQSLLIELVFDNQHSWATDPNVLIPHTSYGLYVTASGEFYSMTGDAQCTGGNMAYTSVCCSLGHFTNFIPTVADHPPLVPPQNPSQAAANVVNGASDEPMYAFAGGVGADWMDWFFVNSDAHVGAQSVGGQSFNPRHFAKKGQYLYFNPLQQFGIGTDGRHIWQYDKDSGVRTANWGTLTNFLFESYYPTDDYIYVLTTNTVTPAANIVAIKKLSLVDGSLVDSFDLSHIFASAIYPVNDNLIYILSAHSSGVLYYLENFADLVYVGKVQNPSVIEASFSTMAFYNGRIFFGGNGRNIDVNSNIKSFIVPCPDEAGLVIASVDRVQDSIAAGDPLDVSWADILEPDNTDQIGLYLDIPGQLGFNPASSLASISTGSQASGSDQLTIPGITAPGTYFVALATDFGSVFITKSDTFTVT